MKHRILATSVLWTLVIILPLLIGNWGAFLLIAVFGFGAYLELVQLVRRSGGQADPIIGSTAFGGLLLALIFIPPWLLPPVALIAPFLCGVVIACLIRFGARGFTPVVLATLATVLLMLLPFGAITLLIHESGLILAIWVVAITKFGDVGALLTGMAIGRHRMSPAISPNKTWEGLAGGLGLSVLVSVAFVLLGDRWLPDSLTPLHAAWTAVLICLAGVVGDLVESALKREAGAKDSGKVIPGIGGFFDLTDSMLLAFPIAYSLTWIII
jgi:phosphatidate cytidylyltransferase